MDLKSYAGIEIEHSGGTGDDFIGKTPNKVNVDNIRDFKKESDKRYTDIRKNALVNKQ